MPPDRCPSRIYASAPESVDGSLVELGRRHHERLAAAHVHFRPEDMHSHSHGRPGPRAGSWLRHAWIA